MWNIFSPDIFMSSNFFYLDFAVSLVSFLELLKNFEGLEISLWFKYYIYYLLDLFLNYKYGSKSLLDFWFSKFRDQDITTWQSLRIRIPHL